MKISIKQSSALSVKPKLLDILESEINKASIDQSHRFITLNFRNLSYSADAGGYHPVEVGLACDNSGCWMITYMSSFCYVGHPYPELVLDVDFNLDLNRFYTPPAVTKPIDQQDVLDFYKVWVSNFINYYEFDAFDQIKVNSW